MKKLTCFLTGTLFLLLSANLLLGHHMAAGMVDEEVYAMAIKSGFAGGYTLLREKNNRFFIGYKESFYQTSN